MDNIKREILFKEIDIIQHCIDRASQNSFFVKGWSVTLVAALWALLPQNANYCLITLITLISTTAFWYVDAFFLRVDRLYRWKYEWVIQNRSITDSFQFDLDPYNEQMLGKDEKNQNRHVPNIYSIFFSSSLLVFYPALPKNYIYFSSIRSKSIPCFGLFVPFWLILFPFALDIRCA